MKPLFPGLRSLRLTAEASGLAPRVMDCLITPTIRHVNLKFDGMYAPLDEAAVIETIRMTQSLQLKSAFIKLANRSLKGQHVTLAMADAIRSQLTLESLCIVGMAPQAMELFAAASQLQDLKVVSFTEWPITGESAMQGGAVMQAREGDRTFPSLKNICMSLARVALPATLKSLTSTQLGYARLRLKEPARPGSYRLDGCLGGLRRFTLLTTIALAFPRTNSTWEDFVPLLVCSQLRIFKLEGRALSLVIGNEELQTMAKSWPQLEVLTIDDFSRKHLARATGPDGDEPPRTTLHGLVCLAVHCPDLRKLRLSIDARIIPDMCKFPVTGQKMEEVSFPLSRVASKGLDPLLIARFICGLWPNQRLPAPRIREGKEGPWADVHIRHARWSQSIWDRPVWERIWMMVYIYLSRRTSPEI